MFGQLVFGGEAFVAVGNGACNVSAVERAMKKKNMKSKTNLGREGLFTIIDGSEVRSFYSQKTQKKFTKLNLLIVSYTQLFFFNLLCSLETKKQTKLNKNHNLTTK